MPAMVDQLVKELMMLSAAERIDRCKDLLASAELDDTGRARISYVLAHAQRAEMKPVDAMQTCQLAMERDMPGDRRSVLMQCLALCQYDLGLFAVLPRTLSDWQELPMTDVLKAYWLMLTGRVLLRQRDPAAYRFFSEAESLFTDPDQAQSRAWAQLSAARLSRLLCDWTEAEQALSRVTYKPYIPKARLLQAEVMLGRGDVEGAHALALAVRDGTHGAPDPVDMARSRYVEAACAIERGSHWNGAILAEEARKVAMESPLIDLELIDAITALRMRIAG